MRVGSRNCYTRLVGSLSFFQISPKRQITVLRTVRVLSCLTMISRMSDATLLWGPCVRKAGIGSFGWHRRRTQFLDTWVDLLRANDVVVSWSHSTFYLSFLWDLGFIDETTKSGSEREAAAFVTFRFPTFRPTIRMKSSSVFKPRSVESTIFLSRVSGVFKAGSDVIPGLRVRLGGLAWAHRGGGCELCCAFGIPSFVHYPVL